MNRPDTALSDEDAAYTTPQQLLVLPYQHGPVAVSLSREPIPRFPPYEAFGRRPFAGARG
jgi:hypothetical protein